MHCPPSVRLTRSGSRCPARPSVTAACGCTPTLFRTTPTTTRSRTRSRSISSRAASTRDPEYSLAYARSRHADSDYQRERRQQYVLQQIRRQLDPLAMLPNIPSSASIAQANLYTTLERHGHPVPRPGGESRVDADRLYQEDFAPAHVATAGQHAGHPGLRNQHLQPARASAGSLSSRTIPARQRARAPS